ncbi:MAG: Flp family type IVb pilin [Rhodospirillaceae bacterium]|nr:Flp family type IVb pilin [Rhodospirillaceae bacterium]
MIARLNRISLKGICFFKCRRGSTAIEYALIASLIAVVIIGAVTMLGGNLSNSFDETAGAVKTAK